MVYLRDPCIKFTPALARLFVLEFDGRTQNLRVWQSEARTHFEVVLHPGSFGRCHDRTIVILVSAALSNNRAHAVSQVGFKAKMPVKLNVPPAVVYEYYDPSVKGRGKPIALTVGDAT